MSEKTNSPPTLLQVNEVGSGLLEIYSLSTEEKFLRQLFEVLFVNHWQGIEYGIFVQGGVLEFQPPARHLSSDISMAI